MAESADLELTPVQLLRRAQKLMGLSDLSHIAYVYLCLPGYGKRRLNCREDTVVISSSPSMNTDMEWPFRCSRDTQSKLTPDQKSGNTLREQRR